jgi:hypothetical protein
MPPPARLGAQGDGDRLAVEWRRTGLRWWSCVRYQDGAGESAVDGLVPAVIHRTNTGKHGTHGERVVAGVARAIITKLGTATASKRICGSTTMGAASRYLRSKRGRGAGLRMAASAWRGERPGRGVHGSKEKHIHPARGTHGGVRVPAAVEGVRGRRGYPRSLRVLAPSQRGGRAVSRYLILARVRSPDALDKHAERPRPCAHHRA